MRRPPARVRARRIDLAAAEAGARSVRCAAGTSRAARACHGLCCSAMSPSVRTMPARGTGCARAHCRLGRAPRQRHAGDGAGHRDIGSCRCNQCRGIPAPGGRRSRAEGDHLERAEKPGGLAAADYVDAFLGAVDAATRRWTPDSCSSRAGSIRSTAIRWAASRSRWPTWHADPAMVERATTGAAAGVSASRRLCRRARWRGVGGAHARAGGLSAGATHAAPAVGRLPWRCADDRARTTMCGRPFACSPLRADDSFARGDHAREEEPLARARAARFAFARRNGSRRPRRRTPWLVPSSRGACWPDRCARDRALPARPGRLPLGRHRHGERRPGQPAGAGLPPPSARRRGHLSPNGP